MEPSGGIDAFDETALERVWCAVGKADASLFGAGADRIGNADVILRVVRFEH